MNTTHQSKLPDLYLTRAIFFDAVAKFRCFVLCRRQSRGGCVYRCPPPTHTHTRTYRHHHTTLSPLDTRLHPRFVFISLSLSRSLLAQFTWCPATGCDRIVRCKGPRACGVNVQCDCGHEFCFVCQKVMSGRATAETVAKACATTACKRVRIHLRSNYESNFGS